MNNSNDKLQQIVVPDWCPPLENYQPLTLDNIAKVPGGTIVSVREQLQGRLWRAAGEIIRGRVEEGTIVHELNYPIGGWFLSADLHYPHPIELAVAACFYELTDQELNVAKGFGDPRHGARWRMIRHGTALGGKDGLEVVGKYQKEALPFEEKRLFFAEAEHVDLSDYSPCDREDMWSDRNLYGPKCVFSIVDLHTGAEVIRAGFGDFERMRGPIVTDEKGNLVAICPISSRFLAQNCVYRSFASSLDLSQGKKEFVDVARLA